MSTATADPHPDAGWVVSHTCQACRAAPGQVVTPAGLLCNECARKLGREYRRGRL